jgi:NAD(P)-dependent dehydrogenase (short-subunit alcohol dehydrogenase family)
VWAKELARYETRVGAAAPGFTRASMVEKMKPEPLMKVISPAVIRLHRTAPCHSSVNCQYHARLASVVD